MKKSWFSLLILTLIVTSAVGFAAPKTTTLRFWTTHIYGPEIETAMNKLIDQWNKENPTIKVIQENIPGGQVQAKLTTAAKSNTLADIVDGWSYQALQLAEMNQVLPLDDLYATWSKNGELKDYVNPSIYKKFYWKGHYYGMPWALDLRVITYRKDLLQQKGIKVPTNWTEFRDAVLATNDPKNGIYGLTYAGGFFNFTGQIFMPFMIQAGGGILNKNGKLAFGSEFYEANLKALEFLTAFAVKDKVTPPGIGAYDWDDTDAIFLGGKAAFSLERGNVITNLMRQRPDMIPKVGILPALQGPKLRAAGGMCNPLFIWRHTKSPAAAKKFVLWLMKNERVLS
jgi:multiple sugar transport system substrate-binding protein